MTLSPWNLIKVIEETLCPDLHLLPPWNTFLLNRPRWKSSGKVLISQVQILSLSHH